MPARHQNHTCGQYLVEGCLNRLLTIASTVQRLTAGVKTQCTLVFCNMDVQADVGVGDADIGTLARALAELVDDGILDLVCYELRVAELF